jgi:hypothetical protein
VPCAPDLTPDDPELVRAASGAWSIVHGFATLWLDGNFDPLLTEQPPDVAAAATLQAWAATLFAAAGAGVHQADDQHGPG